VPEEREALVVGEIADVVAATSGAQPPDGVVVRRAEGPDDYARIAAVHGEVWGGDHGWLAVELAAEKAGGPDALEVLLAETDDGAEVVCAAWVRFEQGTDFASLWGGSTLEGWRGRGIYRALVAQRAAMAAERGFRYLQVDASPDSRPILERLGLRLLTTTTPFVRTP
jgi:ribosomal protein S18 acetylase RimI-like enzyme